MTTIVNVARIRMSVIMHDPEPWNLASMSIIHCNDIIRRSIITIYRSMCGTCPQPD